MMDAGPGFRRRPIVAAGLRPSKRELDKGLLGIGEARAVASDFGCAQARASRRTWCLAARGAGPLRSALRTSRAANTMEECSDGVQGHSRSRRAATKQKGPDPFGAGPLRTELGDARLHACLSRIGLTLAAFQRSKVKRGACS